ncbi:hypothetical protein PLICRDRAFT_55379 [Plicaturopsis crispa FD-325 SS-3]|nr:hypothetical protein PLICRDRAFT_55379 [Plicaturopsis crispa FD-325 SS-3]
MADSPPKPVSPISQVLQSLGLTREDLLKHSDQMRQFLTAEDANSLRVLVRDLEGGQSSSQPEHAPPSAARARSHSTTSHAPSVPTTPIHVKAELADGAMPPRRDDSMEAVIERKSRQARRERRSRREREKTAARRSRSPPPAFNLNMSAPTSSRGTGRVDIFDAPRDATRTDNPMTPQTRKYYRTDYDDGSASRLRAATFSPRPEAQAKTPVTPFNRYYKSPLPPSSPAFQSSPPSSPTRRVYNIVSSPGPMGPLPDEDDYDDLPYTLPPGPYSTAKPDLSYAALVGQAILCSPQHRLTLQEIYDWITIVYPHFQRGDKTWMNSIRHVLSTTACFRKVTRERSAGRTLWAIWDCDLECFKDGGFKKQFCADMAGDAAKNKKKRAATDEGGTPSKKAKRQKKAPQPKSTAPPNPYPMPPTAHSLPFFPPTRPSAHHQSYYQSCMQPLPTHGEMIFPPLPPPGYPALVPMYASSSASTSTAVSTSASASTSQLSITAYSASTSGPSSTSGSSVPPPSVSENSEMDIGELMYPDDEEDVLPMPPSSSSVPSLTPNLSSSSPPTMDETPPESTASNVIRLATPEADDGLEPGITLLNGGGSPRPRAQRIDKGKRKQSNESMSYKKTMAFPPMPESPTLSKSIARGYKAPKPSTPLPPMELPPRTPPPRPSTPPRTAANSRAMVNLSPVRTPLSHKGVHMSPSPSLAHYKSHLDPPPAAAFRGADHGPPGSPEHMRTPSRRRSSSLGTNLFGPPVTPKKLTFPPSASGTQDSPFRTPGSRVSIFDPHDPGSMLDDELSRIGSAAGAQESPAGLFGRGKGLLYESPDAGSPGRWTKWW